MPVSLLDILLKSFSVLDSGLCLVACLPYQGGGGGRPFCHFGVGFVGPLFKISFFSTRKVSKTLGGWVSEITPPPLLLVSKGLAGLGECTAHSIGQCGGNVHIPPQGDNGQCKAPRVKVQVQTHEKAYTGHTQEQGGCPDKDEATRKAQTTDQRSRCLPTRGAHRALCACCRKVGYVWTCKVRT